MTNADLPAVDEVVDAQSTSGSKWFRVDVPDYDHCQQDEHSYLRLGAVPPQPEPGDQLIEQRWAPNQGNAQFAIGGDSYAPQSGWRDHTDGSRVVTTRGDKLEVVSGNYKLIVGSEEKPSKVDDTKTLDSYSVHTTIENNHHSNLVIKKGRDSHTAIVGGDASSVEVGGGIASHKAVGGGIASTTEVGLGVVNNTMIGGASVSNTTIGLGEHATKQVVGASLSKRDVGLASIGHEVVGGAHIFHRDVGGLRAFHTVVAGGQMTATEVGVFNESHKHVGGVDTSLTTVGAAKSLKIVAGSAESLNIVNSETNLNLVVSKTSLNLVGVDLSLGLGIKLGVHLGVNQSETYPKNEDTKLEDSVTALKQSYNNLKRDITAVNAAFTASIFEVKAAIVKLGPS